MSNGTVEEEINFRRKYWHHHGLVHTWEEGYKLFPKEWPTYPLGGPHVSIAVETLAFYPRNTPFFPIDHQEQSTLFLVGKKKSNNCFDRNLFHAAVWDTDLIECSKMNFVEGVIVGDNNELIFLLGSIRLTEKGHKSALVNALTSEISPLISEKTEELLILGLYDTAVRDACVFLECKLREFTQCEANDTGLKLIDRLFDSRSELRPPNVTNTSYLAHRNSWRRFFAYIRNDFAHNLREIDLLTATQLLRRCSALLGVLHDLERGYFNR